MLDHNTLLITVGIRMRHTKHTLHFPHDDLNRVCQYFKEKEKRWTSRRAIIFKVDRVQL